MRRGTRGSESRASVRSRERSSHVRRDGEGKALTLGKALGKALKRITLGKALKRKGTQMERHSEERNSGKGTPFERHLGALKGKALGCDERHLGALKGTWGKALGIERHLGKGTWRVERHLGKGTWRVERHSLW